MGGGDGECAQNDQKYYDLNRGLFMGERVVTDKMPKLT